MSAQGKEARTAFSCVRCNPEVGSLPAGAYSDGVCGREQLETIITVGTQVQTAVLHTAAEAALRGYKVIVPVDGMSGDSAYPEQYTAWHLANTQRIRQHVTLTKVDLIGY